MIGPRKPREPREPFPKTVTQTQLEAQLLQSWARGLTKEQIDQLRQNVALLEQERRR